jgi:hypothetical protein
MDPLAKYIYDQYKDAAADVTAATELIQRAYTKLNDLSNNTISHFAASDYFNTLGFINRMRHRCETNMSALKGDTSDVTTEEQKCFGKSA